MGEVPQHCCQNGVTASSRTYAGRSVVTDAVVAAAAEFSICSNLKVNVLGCKNGARHHVLIFGPKVTLMTCRSFVVGACKSESQKLTCTTEIQDAKDILRPHRLYM